MSTPTTLEKTFRDINNGRCPVCNSKLDIDSEKDFEYYNCPKCPFWYVKLSKVENAI